MRGQRVTPRARQPEQVRHCTTQVRSKLTQRSRNIILKLRRGRTGGGQKQQWQVGEVKDSRTPHADS